MSNHSSMPRFYGGHYDSVKQRAYRDFLLETEVLPWHEELRRRFTARLRLDILLGGNVIITDAQFYDGLFFHSLVKTHSAREDFFDFLREAKERLDAPLIEVRRREGRLLQMFAKPLIFSSLISDESKDLVHNAMACVLGQAKNKGVTYSHWKNLLQEVHTAIDTPVAQDDFQQVIDNIAILDEAPHHVFRTWESRRVEGFPQLIKNAKQELTFVVPTTGNPGIDETLHKIESEMKKDFPNRSHIEQWVRACRNSDLSDKRRQRILDDVWHGVCRVYNTAIADQHRCTSIDWGEIPTPAGKEQDIVGELSPNTIAAIAEQPWVGFWGELNRGNLSAAWKKWRDVICEPHSYDQHQAKKTLIKLVNCIEQSYGGYQRAIDAIVSGGSSTASYSADGCSLSINPLQLAMGIVIAGKEAASGFRERLNLVKHGLRISGLGEKGK